MLIKFIIVILRCVDHISSLDSVVGLEWAGPGVGGGIVFPLSVSVGLALKLLLSDILVGVSLSGFLINGVGGSNSNEGQDDGIFHFTFFKFCNKFIIRAYIPLL